MKQENLLWSHFLNKIFKLNKEFLWKKKLNLEKEQYKTINYIFYFKNYSLYIYSLWIYFKYLN